ncbi:MAG: Hsp20/alpha crystallin family protein [Bacteroidota bacterium]
MMNRFFEGDMMDFADRNYSSKNASLPAVNIHENNDEFIIEVAAPGMKKKDFKISYDNGRLTISSDMKEEVTEGESYTRREFNYQAFQRSFEISHEIVDGDKIKARYEDGILRILLPKREEVKPKPAREISIL